MISIILSTVFDGSLCILVVGIKSGFAVGHPEENLQDHLNMIFVVEIVYADAFFFGGD